MGDTSPVWLYQIGASLYGVQDMAGNVWQLVNDWYDSTYYAKSPSSNPTGPASGQYRVLRGGAWDTSESTILTTNRGKIYPTETGSSTGFRCARSLP
jgi:formylglycine-generating enzyme required for sulfatase activity